MKSREILSAVVMAGLCASASVPEVSNVTTVQNSVSRRVTVNYSLSAPGIVTMAAQTNRGDGVWVDVDDANLTYVAGDVNKIVSGGDHVFTWQPHKSWPGQMIVGGNFRIGVKAWATDTPPDYMVVSLVSANAVSFYSSAAAIPGGVTNDLYKTEYLVMRKCPAANVTWRMGSPTTEFGRVAATETPHEVTLADDYYIGVYPITQRQYELLIGTRPSYFKLDADYATRPVEQVSYENIRGKTTDGFNWPSNGHDVSPTSFMGILRLHTGLNGFDLPTEEQWEFACRAGCGAALYNGKEVDGKTVSVNLNPLARYVYHGGLTESGDYAGEYSTADYGTAKVDTFEPNAWGLYDMLGDVWEWCLDSMEGADDGAYRVNRGGGWKSGPTACRCAFRNYGPPNAGSNATGFRIACPADMTK